MTIRDPAFLAWIIATARSALVQSFGGHRRRGGIKGNRGQFNKDVHRRRRRREMQAASRRRNRANWY
jgi:hypothetical protein